MNDTLYKKMKLARNEYDLKERMDWIMDAYPTQIILTIALVAWAWTTETAIQ